MAAAAAATSAVKKFDPSREASALSSFQMIHPKEAATRRKIGLGIFVAGLALFAAKGASFLSVGTWASVFCSGIVLYRTGTLSQ